MAPIPGLRELFEQVRDGKPVINYPLEGEVISHPGEHRYWTVNYTPVYAADGTIQAISAASLEVTAQKKAEVALLQSEKLAAVGRLASSISHEINNPLESITNLLYLISASDELPAPVREYVDIAQGEIARVSQIATQTLRFHRQAARSTLVNAEQLFAPVLNLFRGRLINSGIALETTFASSTQVLCLENEIRQVLSNLVANAIDAMRVGGRLRLRAHDSHDPAITDPRTARRGLRITVADTGHGMSTATQARIFEPFFTTKDLNGTGLGLWISSEILQRHYGSLSVRSSQHPLHHGTIFSLFLPLGVGEN
jgi:signal transduction histidine kinase